MTVTSTQSGDVMVLRVAGRLDAVTALDFEMACHQHLDAKTPRVVMDLQGVDYLASAGLRAILMAGKQVKAAGGEFALCGLKGPVKNTFELSGFHRLFPVFDSLEAFLHPQ